MSALSISGLHRFFTRHVRILCKLEAAPAIITVTYLHNWLFRLILFMRAHSDSEPRAHLMFSVFLSLSLALALSRFVWRAAIFYSSVRRKRNAHWSLAITFEICVWTRKNRHESQRRQRRGCWAWLFSFATVPAMKTVLLLPQWCYCLNYYILSRLKFELPRWFLLMQITNCQKESCFFGAPYTKFLQNDVFKK